MGVFTPANSMMESGSNFNSSLPYPPQEAVWSEASVEDKGAGEGLPKNYFSRLS